MIGRVSTVDPSQQPFVIGANGKSALTRGQSTARHITALAGAARPGDRLPPNCPCLCRDEPDIAWRNRKAAQHDACHGRVD
jgi:hypothetical protein